MSGPGALMVRAGKRYRAATGDEVLQAATAHGFRTLAGSPYLTSPGETRRHLLATMAGRTSEAFCAIALDNRHRVLEWRELFQGTIDGASVHPREVVKWALAANAAAVILVHNHPSGVAEPSQADEIMTTRLRDALSYFDIRVLDHLIVAGAQCVSLAERGLI